MTTFWIPEDRTCNNLSCVASIAVLCRLLFGSNEHFTDIIWYCVRHNSSCSFRHSSYVYKPSWNNFTNYPTFALNMPLMIVWEKARERERQEEKNRRVDAHLQMTSSSSSFNDLPLPSYLSICLSLILLSSSIASNFHIEATHASHPILSPSTQKLSNSALVQYV